MVLLQTHELCTKQLIPAAAEILEQVFDASFIVDIGRLQQTSRHIRHVSQERRPCVLQRRGLQAQWSWRKGHAAESALFFDMQGSPNTWTPGPNDRQGNVMYNVGSNDDGDIADDLSWLWLSGGTDWQGFQGGFRCISDVGLQPQWVTFRVRIATPSVSGAHLTFAAAQRTWAFEDIIFAFHYSGDERAQQRRCFVVQTGTTQQGDTSYQIRLQPEVVADCPYQVAVHFDWTAAKMSVFVDGILHVDGVPFKATKPLRFAAIYNWRSSARTAFSELMLGNVCPYGLYIKQGKLPQPCLAKWASSASVVCCKRSLHQKHESTAVIRTTTPFLSSPTNHLLFASAVLGLLAAAAMQQFFALV